MRIYTKRGDGGETDLLFGGRVSKTDPRTEAGGTVDEAVSALGLARSLSREPLVASIVEELQRALFTVGAELATASENHAKLEQHFKAVSADMTSALEAHIDALDAEVELPPSFIVPGASPASAALDLARTTLRRAERRAVELGERNMLSNREVLRYLNRASDLVFMLARYEDRALPPQTVGGPPVDTGAQEGT
ncbi:MAG: cob(I)yrinic acid a,c-diamide adenosyltransferase [Chloroflexi bacterium]|nr:cob(I)yrinic acid a,c-diamide adenosyltransferase [Chloroflexota bacterium]MCH7655844.1 cob(I)yrinic acid a,c-diamide adenosyltransferase [Chloroflexota bacterium]